MRYILSCIEYKKRDRKISCLCCQSEIAVSCGKHRSARISHFPASLPFLNLHISWSANSLVWMIDSCRAINPYGKSSNFFSVITNNADPVFCQHAPNLSFRCTLFDFLFQLCVHVILPSRKFPEATVPL